MKCLFLNIYKASLKQFKFLSIAFVSVACGSGSKDLKQTEVENSTQLKSEIIQEIAKTMSPKDTLFLVTQRILGVCGNDDRYDGKTTINEKLEEQKHIKENPYFIDLSKGFDEQYTIDGKILFTGTAFNNEFSTTTQHFNNDSLKIKKTVRDIQALKVKKDSVEIILRNQSDNEDSRTFLFVKNNSKWEKR
ncbi:hypothetical protein SAMN05660477_01708 [Soonwooa buanensis]|uniref:Uncharacterized protein n=2 Tax=Soonwooa buanensis TaxID=619805 RepID=A0A1T5F1K6_9FLAO|nr:hypothetical protein SAMN05660477_01708 [Soonwooa buanensis]